MSKVMRIASSISALLLAAGCGGSPSSSGGSTVNAFTGTVGITGAVPAGATTCVSTKIVHFSSAGADVHTVSVPGGGCVQFVNDDVAGQHQPAANSTNPCPELNAPGPLGAGQSFTTPLLGGPKTCDWQDVLNPPGSGGGGGY